MTEHQKRAKDLESELDEMEERSDRLESEIDDAREDWEHKKSDSGVPGAPPDPDDEGGPQPETSYPTKRDPDDDL